VAYSVGSCPSFNPTYFGSNVVSTGIKYFGSVTVRNCVFLGDWDVVNNMGVTMYASDNFVINGVVIW
jgi:hypothetical protein